MKIRIALFVGLSFIIPARADAMIYVPPVEEQVPTAEIVVVGTLVKGKDVDGEHRGHILVTRVLYGGPRIRPKDKIEVRWKPKPTNLPPGFAHTADYTFSPETKTESIFVVQPRQDPKKLLSLNWGTQYPVKDETKIKKLVTRGMDRDFVGITEAEAIALARKRNIPARVTMRDGKSHPVTTDHSKDRVNFTVKNGTVTQVNRG